MNEASLASHSYTFGLYIELYRSVDLRNQSEGSKPFDRYSKVQRLRLLRSSQRREILSLIFSSTSLRNSFAICRGSSIICRNSSAFCLYSSVIFLLSSVFCRSSSVMWWDSSTICRHSPASA